MTRRGDITIPQNEVDAVCAAFGGRDFSTQNFVLRLSQLFPKTWTAMTDAYGEGGKGSGNRNNANTKTMRILKKQVKAFFLKDLKLRRLNLEEQKNLARPWGSSSINYWKVNTVVVYPDEINGDKTPLFEGALTTVTVNRYERSPMARLECIASHGTTCAVCEFDFEKTYGAVGKGFIHIHHLKPLAKIAETYKIDPVKDLVPVCPNCHAMLHKGPNDRLMSVDELKRLIADIAKAKKP